MIFISKNKNNKPLFSAVIGIFFLMSQLSFAQLAYTANGYPVPEPGTPVHLTSAFKPTQMIGINIYPDEPLKLDFVFQKGEDIRDNEIYINEASRIIKYFLTSLTLPEKEMWVNLSPHEKNRIIPDSFSQTAMGRDVLIQDYFLKQLSATLMDPDNEIGQEYWDRLYAHVYEKYGVVELPSSTFNKIWIVPERAQIYEHKQGALLVESHLKVMMEEDYLSIRKDQIVNRTDESSDQIPRDIQELSSDIIKEVMLPVIEKEVNTGETFKNLRQIYSAMVLAAWYKNNLKKSIVSSLYVDQKKTTGLQVDDPNIHLKVYEAYVEAFRKGVINLIREEYNPVTQEIIPRKYFTGGVELLDDYQEVSDSAMMSIEDKIRSLSDQSEIDVVSVDLQGVGENKDLAMLGKLIEKASLLYRQYVPRKVYDDWTIVQTGSFDLLRKRPEADTPAAVEVVTDYLSAFIGDPDRFLDHVRNITGKVGEDIISIDKLTKKIKVGYLDSGRHKHVYVVAFEQRIGPPIEMAIVLKREQSKGDIDRHETEDQRRLQVKGDQRGVDYPVPRLGAPIRTSKGFVLYAEKFIKGPTADDLYQRGRLTLNLRRQIVRNLFMIGTGLSDSVSIPTDIHRRNWIVSAGEPIMIDIGKRRVTLVPRGVVTNPKGEVHDYRRAKTFLLMSIMHFYGYQDRRDKFIFNAIRDVLGPEESAKLFQEVISFVEDQQEGELLRSVHKKSGKTFISIAPGVGPEKRLEALEKFTNNFTTIFTAYLNDPESDTSPADFKSISPMLLATLLSFSLAAADGSEAVEVDQKVFEALRETVQVIQVDEQSSEAPTAQLKEEDPDLADFWWQIATPEQRAMTKRQPIVEVSLKEKAGRAEETLGIDQAALTEDVKTAVASLANFSTEDVLQQLGLDATAAPMVREILTSMPDIESTGANQWSNRVGGIDLNPELLEMEIQNNGEAEIFSIPIPADVLDQLQIDGFQPTINNIIPIQSLPQMLGWTQASNK